MYWYIMTIYKFDLTDTWLRNVHVTAISFDKQTFQEKREISTLD